jgi:AmiR/NasT family two-component response regulator
MVHKKVKMIKFVNDIGCRAEFEEGISEKQVNERLKMMGSNWRRVED